MLRRLAGTDGRKARLSPMLRACFGVSAAAVRIVCVLALLAPGTCFLSLSATLSLRAPAEEENGSAEHAAAAVAAADSRRVVAVRRVSQVSAVAVQPQIGSRHRPRPAHRKLSHSLANGLCAPLRC